MPSPKKNLLYITGLFLFTLPFFATAQGITRNEMSTFEKSQPFRAEDYATAQSVLPIATLLPGIVSSNKQQNFSVKPTQHLSLLVDNIQIIFCIDTNDEHSKKTI